MDNSNDVTGNTEDLRWYRVVFGSHSLDDAHRAEIIIERIFNLRAHTGGQIVPFETRVTTAKGIWPKSYCLDLRTTPKGAAMVAGARYGYKVKDANGNQVNPPLPVQGCCGRSRRI